MGRSGFLVEVGFESRALPGSSFGGETRAQPSPRELEELGTGTASLGQEY